MSRQPFEHLGFRIAYDGRPFSGFQAQHHKESIQDHLEDIFRKVLKFKKRLHCSSRTDTGVHALDQWIMLPDGYSLWSQWSEENQKRFRLSLNALLKERASVWAGYALPSDFRLSRRVDGKEYHYLVAEGASPLPLLRNQAWFIRDRLDLDLIRESLEKIVGLHDFSGFANRSRNDRRQRDPKKKLWKAEVIDELHPLTTTTRPHRILRFVFAADGFLYNMVRNLVGTLVEIGRGKSYSVRDVLDARDRRLAGIKAPAHGLVLAKTFVNLDDCQELPHF